MFDRDFDAWRFNLADGYYWVSRWVIRIWNAVRGTAQRIDDIWLLGDYLAAPFWAIATWIERIYNVFYHFQFIYPAIVRKLQVLWDDFHSLSFDVLDIGGLLDFLQSPVNWFLTYIVSFWGHLGELLENPVSWLSGMILEFSGDLWELAQDAPSYIIRAIEDNLPTVWAWLSDPTQFLLDILYELNALIPDFLLDPLGFIEDIVSAAVPDLDSLIKDPAQWLLDAIWRLSGDLYEIVVNAPGWFLMTLISVIDEELEDIEEWLISTVDRLLNRVW